jgi:hypothetical protein
MEKLLTKMWKKNGKIASSKMWKVLLLFMHILSNLFFGLFKLQIDVFHKINMLNNNKYYLNIKEVLYYEIHM